MKFTVRGSWEGLGTMGALPAATGDGEEEEREEGEEEGERMSR